MYATAVCNKSTTAPKAQTHGKRPSKEGPLVTPLEASATARCFGTSTSGASGATVATTRNTTLDALANPDARAGNRSVGRPTERNGSAMTAAAAAVHTRWRDAADRLRSAIVN